jgi:hypothetical protein
VAFKDKHFLGMLNHGVYDSNSEVTEYDDVDPSILQHYYGVTQQRSRRSTTAPGAGHFSNEDISEGEGGYSSDEGELFPFCYVKLTFTFIRFWIV